MPRSTPHFFIPFPSVKKAILLSKEETHHACKVRRLKTGDSVLLFDGEGHTFEGIIQGKKRGQALVTILREKDFSPPSLPAVDLSVSPPRGKRMDFLVEKCSELGARAILPFHSSHSTRSQPGEEKVRRWRRIAVEASKQSGRSPATRIEGALPLKEILQKIPAYSRAFLFHPSPQFPSTERIFREVGRQEKVLLFIGPEGGFTKAEIQEAESCGALPLSIPFPILRVETAAIVTLASLLSHSR